MLCPGRGSREIRAEEASALKRYRAKRYWRQQMPDYRTRQYRRYQKRQARRRRLFSAATVLLMLMGLGLIGYFLVLGEDSLVPRAISSATEGDKLATSAPKDTTLELTIPKMARVDNLPVYDTPWDSESALDVSASHLDSSGFPWQEGSNVYIAGHRMGFPGTKSFLVFYDLDVLEEGDEVILTDSDGTKYAYKVFAKYVADPTDWGPTEPVAGKSIVTLQTCTLPDYTQRLIVQGELTKVEPGQEADSTQEAKPQQGESEQAELAPADPVQEVGTVPVEPEQEVEPVPLGSELGEPGQLEPTQEVDPMVAES